MHYRLWSFYRTTMHAMTQCHQMFDLRVEKQKQYIQYNNLFDLYEKQKQLTQHKNLSGSGGGEEEDDEKKQYMQCTLMIFCCCCCCCC